AGRGADLAFSYNRSRDDVERAAAAVRALGRRATVCAADLTKAAECDALVAHVVETLGRLDVLVHMASRYAKAPLDALTERDGDGSLAVEARAAFLCARAAAPHMRAAGGGRIVLFADWLARSGRPRYPGYLPYYVAKAAVLGLTEALALELAGDQILVNAVAPGPVLAPPDLGVEERRAVERGAPPAPWGGEVGGGGGARPRGGGPGRRPLSAGGGRGGPRAAAPGGGLGRGRPAAANREASCSLRAARVLVDHRRTCIPIHTGSHVAEPTIESCCTFVGAPRLLSPRRCRPEHGTFGARVCCGRRRSARCSPGASRGAGSPSPPGSRR